MVVLSGGREGREGREPRPVRSRGIRRTLLLLSAAFALDAGGAHADEPAAAAPQSDSAQRRANESAIEQITITARKREENLQDTPISITALSAVQLDDAGVTRTDDLTRFAPNLKFEQSPGAQNSAGVQIRGIGNADNIATRDSGVGIYIDGVYLARAQGQLIGLGDIERIEVLRGPQGTLYGRNTIGGAVNVITRKPDTEEFGAVGSARVGNYNLFESRASVNIPLVPERAAALVSFQSATREGYTKNRLTGQETDDRRMLGMRIALRLLPTENVELLLTGDQTRAHQSGRGGECRFNPASFATAPFVQVQQLSGFRFVEECLANEANDELTYASPLRSKENLDTYGLTSQIIWDPGDFSLRSLTSWQRQENASRVDLTFSPVAGPGANPIPLQNAPYGFVNGLQDENDQVSQELNLNGEALGGALKYTTGLFAFYEKTTPAAGFGFAGFNLCQADPNSLVFPQAFEAAVAPAFGIPPGVPLPAFAKQIVICMGSSQTLGPRITTNAYAGYGQATYDVTDALHLTGGLRYSTESRDFQFMQMNFIGPTTQVDAFAAAPIGTRTERFDKWTPLVNVTYDLTDAAIVYGSYSRGFKSGGFNGRPNAMIPISLEPFEQEILDNYEVGLKSSWLDNRLQTNLALFYGDYDDIQATILSSAASGAFASRVANAGKAVIRGGELELTAIPTPGLLLRAGLGFTDAELREFDDIARGPVVAGTQTFVPISRRGQSFFNTPNFTGTFSASYTLFEFAGLGDLTARANWYHQNEVNYGPSSDTLRQGKYGLLSGQLALTLADGKTEIGLFGENLLDRRYLNGGINFEDGFALSDAYYGAPRTYGVQIRREF